MTDGQWISHVNAIDSALKPFLVLLRDGGLVATFGTAIAGLTPRPPPAEGPALLPGAPAARADNLWQLPFSSVILKELLVAKAAAQAAAEAAEAAAQAAAAAAAEAAAQVAAAAQAEATAQAEAREARIAELEALLAAMSTS